MDKEKIIEILNNSNSKTEALLKFGYSYINGRTLKILQNFADEVNFDLNSFKENRTPTRFCQNCGKILIKDNKNRKFCSSSCAAKINNIGRKHSKEVKEKISKTMINLNRSHLYDEKGNFIGKLGGCIKKSEEWVKICAVCGKEFCGVGFRKKQNKCCSKECVIFAKTSRTYQNGSRKIIYYENKWYGKVILESSWEEEIAKYLDKLNIKWNRPKPIRWLDLNNKEHLYFPDFYLEEYDIYLDPKNPYCMEKDKLKMKIVSEKINILFGNVGYIIQGIEKIIALEEAFN